MRRTLSEIDLLRVAVLHVAAARPCNRSSAKFAPGGGAITDRPKARRKIAEVKYSSRRRNKHVERRRRLENLVIAQPAAQGWSNSMPSGIALRIRIGLRIWIVLLSALAAVSAAEHRGRVLFNNLGVPGAVVTASRGDQKRVAITDAPGCYRFHDLADGPWRVRIEMQAFSTIERDVTVEHGAADAAWELKLLPIDQIHGLQKPAESSPASPIRFIKDGESPTGALSLRTDTQAPFRRIEVDATAIAAQHEEKSDAISGGAFNGLDRDELNRQAEDGFLISGSSRNSGASFFGQPRSFGNARGLIRSLYNGSAGFTIDNSALDARPYSPAGIDTRTPAYNRMQGAFSLGGPLRIPHIVRHGPTFYVGYQFSRNRNAETATGLVPTLAERNGDLAGSQGQIIDPIADIPFVANRIPEDRISPQAKSLLNLIPLPNFTGNPHYNYQVPLVSSSRADQAFVNVGRQLGRKNQLSGAFSLQSARSETPTIFGFPSTSRSLGSSLSVSLERNFTHRLGSTFGFRFSRQSSQTSSFFGARENVSGVAGIMGNNQEPVNWGPPALTFFSGITSLSDATPSSNSSQAVATSHSGWWNRGDHTLTFGGEYRRQQVNHLAQQNPRGTFTFTGASTLGPSGILSAGARNDFASFLLGIPDTVAIAFGNADKYFRSSAYHAYVADDWRLNRRLTFSLGIRWEYGSPVTERYGRLVNLDIAPGFTAVAPVIAYHAVGPLSGVRYPDALLHTQRSGFQPRIGFAWKPILASSLIVRGGYGIYYNSSPYQSIAIQMAQQAPLSRSLSLQNTAAHPLTLANGFNAAGNAATNTFAVDPDLKIGYVHIGQLALQLDLPVSLQLTAAYRGTLGRNALQEMLPNTHPAGAVNPCPDCPGGFRYMISSGTSVRHAGAIQLRRRLRGGLAASSEYTFSKSIDDAAPGATSPGGAVFIAQDWRNLRGERALSSFDQRHTAGFELEYTTGMGVSGGMLLRGWRGALYKEWTVSTRINVGSGMPQTPVFPSAIAGTGVTGPLRPDVTTADIHAAPPGMHLNPAAYRAPEAGRWGTAGRNSITGPSQFNLDATVARTFRTSDRTALNLSIVAANALNHVSFTSWNATVGSAQFGLPVAPRPMRNVRTSIRWSF